jgi:Holliday junction resolvase RusA-like endonuclease
MYLIPVKPLSLNHAYRGRRFETPELKAFKTEVMANLPNVVIPKGKLAVKYIFGVSSKNADGDNLIKCLQDALAVKYNFNDRQIYFWEVAKVDVKKGEEFIGIEMTPWE